jgi:DNA replication protein DnaC
MVYKVTHEQLNGIIKQYYDKKLSLFVFGAFGIGKSFVVRDTAMEIAKSRAREFVEWNKLDRKKKQEVFEYPEKYFVLIDERLSEYDSSDIKGLPNFKEDKEILEWKVPFGLN